VQRRLDMNDQPVSQTDTRTFSGLIISRIKMSITIYPWHKIGNLSSNTQLRAFINSTSCSVLNPLTPELNPSEQRCLTRFFTGDFASWTVHFVNICVKHQQIHQLVIQLINYVWYLLHVSALHCHPQGAFLVTSEKCAIEEQSIEYCGGACCV
jgi:hypothetical protein